MRLTYHTDYGLRLLMLLALEPEQLHTIEEVAARYGVSKSHLMKVAMTLTQAGLVESVRGRNGGLKLARAANEIRIGEAVRATEDNFDIVECFDSETNTCSVAPACRLKGILKEASNGFLKVLDGYTLAELVKSPTASKRMAQLIPLTRMARK